LPVAGRLAGSSLPDAPLSIALWLGWLCRGEVELGLLADVGQVEHV
jgi:hypothetical protein